MATETVSSATSKKNATKAAAEPAAATAIVPARPAGGIQRSTVNSTDLVIRDDDMSDVEFNRVWYQAAEGQKPLYLLPIKVSSDVRDQYKSKYPAAPGAEQGSLFQLAFEVMKDVSPSDRCLFQAKEPVGAKRGDVAFMLIPARLGLTLAEGLKRNMVVQVQALKKVPIKNRAGLDVMAWDYKARVLTQYNVITQIDTNGIIMPSGDEIEAVEEEPAF